MKTRLLTCFFVFAFSLLCANLYAQTTYTWIGGSSGNWTTNSNWSPSGYPGQSSLDIANFATSNITITINPSASSLTISKITTPYGISGITLSASTGKILTVTSGLSLTQGSGSGAVTVVTFSGAGKFVVGGTTTPGFNDQLAVGSGGTLYFNTGSTLDMGSAQKGVTNNGTLIFLSGSTFKMSNTGNFFINNGNFYSYGASYTLSGSGTPGVTITNNGNFRDHGSTFTYTGQNCALTNGSAGNMYLSGTTMNFGSGTNNGNTFTNSSSGIVTADSSTTLNFKTQNAGITNNGIFNAGITRTTAPFASPCIIDLTGQASLVYNTATFNLGSTSELINGGYISVVTNTGTGTFTLESDPYGSATLGAIPVATSNSGGGYFTGNFNVQRYITGGSSSYRAYRLLASPVNQSANLQGAGTFSIDYLNNNASVTNPNAIAGTYTVHGALTGGKGGPTNGFSVYGKNNPTIYLYKESLPSSNSTFVSGKFAGVTQVTSSNVTVLSGTSTSTPTIPTGNGYLFYFIGDNSDTTWSPTARTPNSATVTAIGTINQNSSNGHSANTYTNTTLWWNSSTTLSYTTANPGTNNTGNGAGGVGFNLLGNPYASIIDLHKLWTDNGNPSYVNFYELVDINPNQPYVSYNANTGAKSSTTYSSQYIASGQGFFVQATTGSQSVVFKEDQKIYNTALLNSSSTTPILLNAQNPGSAPSVISEKNASLAQQTGGPTGLHMKLILDTVSFDECGIYFHPSGSDNYNNNDAVDLDGVSPKVFMSSITADGVRTGINTLADYTHGKRIKLYVKALKDGIYKLNLEDIFNIDTVNYKVYLIDKKLNDSLDMVHYKTYNFNFYTADTADFDNRFVLALEPKPTPPYDLIAFTGQKATGSIMLNWNTEYEGDYTSFGLEKLGADGQYSLIDSVQSNGSGTYNFNDQEPIMGNNIYRLAQSDIHGKVSFAGPINITFNSNTANGLFTIYPNPSKDMINIDVNSAAAGSKNTPLYQASIYDLSGTTMNNRQVNTNTWTQDISGYKAGVYILELKTADGNVVGKAKFVKTN